MGLKPCDVRLNMEKKRFNPGKMSLLKMRFNTHKMANLILSDKTAI